LPHRMAVTARGRVYAVGSKQRTLDMLVRSKAGLAAAAVLTAVLLSAPGSSAQAPRQPGAPTYDELVARAKAGDANVDYLALRDAYAESPSYDPYGSKLGELQSEMFEAYRRGDCAAVLAKAESILAANFVHVDAHLAAGLCHEKLGNEAAMRRERQIARGLIDSILQSGDGKSEQTAFVVIEVAEEYSLLRALGLRPSNQALIHAQGHSYDRFDTKSNDTGQQVVVFFNVDRPLAVLDRELRPEKK
jgi:Domain of unknown function (DUF4919)